MSSLEHATNRTELMSTDEILTRLRDRISQQTPAFRSAFHKYDRRRRGKISKRVFREVRPPLLHV
jgi:Ca2+-binding EF-hand superfamily protein